MKIQDNFSFCNNFLHIQLILVFGFGVILLSCIVVLLTAISMSAIATNGEIKNGGCYYLVSRSLGPEYGGAIGLIFYIANTINASMNCVGLAEALRDILKEYDFYLIDGGINDIRIYAIGKNAFLNIFNKFNFQLFV